ncbi:FHA domain-containing protein PS1 isoform X2 [Rhodamnia argentea]|uniref:FHA domain-containing protein PS1 isoform X2 n=1 Tax=Rhodamnia argentea TaxID=178133 RepID=A0A8B8NVS3_9MYRT|nr:FHA domain-containing protein PS1 isoform X2 [Rhodamnia argentea]
MAIHREQTRIDEDDEPRIPVFTVVKNGAVLKNIFVVNNPPPSPGLAGPESAEHDADAGIAGREGRDEMLIVGRHPDCHIMLTHPSISRFHLQIHSDPSRRKLSVVDLSSVHGTWVSGKKIEPRIVVELSERDTLRVGGSSREYRLHWVPLSRAYDFENPFVLASDASGADEEKVDEDSMIDKGKEEEGREDDDSLEIGCEDDDNLKSSFVLEDEEHLYQDSFDDENKGIYSPESLSKGIEALALDDCEELPVIFQSPSQLPIPEIGCEYDDNLKSSFVLEDEEHLYQDSDNDENKGIHSAESLSKGVEALALDDCEELLVNNRSPSQLPIPEIGCEDDDNLKSSFVLEDEEHLYQYSFDDEKKGIHLAESLSKGVEALALDGCEELPVNNQSPSQLPIPENRNASTYGEKETDTGIGSKAVDDFFIDAELLQTEPMHTSSPFRILFDVDNKKFNEEKWSTEVGIATELVSSDKGSIRSAHDDLENCLVAEAFEESKCSLSIDREVGDCLSHPSAPYPHSSCPEIFSEMENQQLGQEDHAEQPFNTSGSLSAEGKTRRLRKERKLSTTMIDDLRRRKGCSSAGEIPEESQKQIIHIDNQEDGDILSHHFAKSLVDAITSSEFGREILLKTTDQHLNNENQMPQYGSVSGRLSESSKESSPLRQSCTKSKSSSIWSRRGKPSTVLQLQTNRRKGMTKSAATASRNKEHNQNNHKSQLSGVPFLGLDGEEEEIFTPDKENLTPNTRLLKSLKKMSKMEVAEARPLEPFKRSSSKLYFIANICNEEDVFCSDKDNQTPEVLREQKVAGRASESSSRLKRELGLKRGAERSAFKSLNVRPRGQSTASGGATKSGYSVDGVRATGNLQNKSYGEPNKSWIVVVDTTSILNKESRKSLQLLQGLKGTQLVIPRIVIRELDCLKRHTSVFRRTTEVSSALEWIEDTMINLKWWIHVQRSIEEGMSIALTPPATPHCIFGDARETFSAATPGGSVMGIVSPTTEDHILESALFYRKTNPNGQLVLLSNDISLKIKAMAEGLLCETAQEFRESLVNPFSDRFMWADSSPRGQTWSCLDDIVLREKYYSRPSKKSARGEGLSGLKLILLHNSQYGQQIRSVG